MSDFGMFEADEATGLEPRVAARTAARKLEAALDEVRGKFGKFLLGATGIDEFGDRWHYSKHDIRKVVEPYVFPNTGTMRRIQNAMKQDWKLAHPYKLAVEDAGFGSMPTADGHRNQDLQQTYHPSSGNLIPQDDFEGYKGRVDQGGPEKVESNDFTPGGDSGKQARRVQADSPYGGVRSERFPEGFGHKDPPWEYEDSHNHKHPYDQELEYGQHAPLHDDYLPLREPGDYRGKHRANHEAAALVADIYTDFARSAGLRVASLDTLDHYASTGIAEADYRLLESMIIRASECDDSEDDSEGDADDSESEDSGSEAPKEAPSSSESDEDDSDDDEDSDEDFGGDSDSEDDSEDSEGDDEDYDFGGDDSGGEQGGDPSGGGQSYTVPEQAPDLDPQMLNEIPHDDTDGSAPIPPEVVDSLLGLPPGTIEQLLLQEVEQGQGGGGDQFGGAPQGGGDDFLGEGGGDNTQPPRMARRRTALEEGETPTGGALQGPMEMYRGAPQRWWAESEDDLDMPMVDKLTQQYHDDPFRKHGPELDPAAGHAGFGEFSRFGPDSWDYDAINRMTDARQEHERGRTSRRSARSFWAAPDESEDELTERQKREQKDSLDTQHESWLKEKAASRRQASQQECDICKHEHGHPGVPAVVDGKTVHGPWAFMCGDHFDSHGVGLGTGRGQKLGSRSARTFWAAEDEQPAGGEQAAPAQDPAAAAGGMDPNAMAQGGGMMPPPGSAAVAPAAPPAPLENQPAEDQLLDMASQAVTQMIDRETQEYQQIIDPLTQALQSIQFAQQVESAEHPLDVTPAQGSVNVDPSQAPAAQANPMQQQAMRRQAKRNDILRKAAYVIADRYGLSEHGYRAIVAATLGRRDYEHILEAVRLAHPDDRGDVGGHLAHLFAAGNPRFNKDTFMKAVMAGTAKDRYEDKAYTGPRDKRRDEHGRQDQLDWFSGSDDGTETPYRGKGADNGGPDPVGINASRGRLPFDRPRLAGETWVHQSIPDSFEFDNDKPQSRDNMTINDLPKMPGGHVGSSQKVVDRYQRWQHYRQQRGLPASDGEAGIHNFNQTSRPGKPKVGDDAANLLHRSQGFAPDGPKVAPKVKVPKAVNPVLKGKGSPNPGKPIAPKAPKAATKEASFFTRKVSGWKWDDHLSGYLSKEARNFTCACGEKVASPSYKTCACGKIWNVYAIGDSHHLASDTADVYIAREIPVRDNVIMANRKMAGVADNAQQSHRELLAEIERLADWTKYDGPDPSRALGKDKPANPKVAPPPKDWATRLPKGDPSKKGGTWTPPTIPRKKK